MYFFVYKQYSICSIYSIVTLIAFLVTYGYCGNTAHNGRSQELVFGIRLRHLRGRVPNLHMKKKLLWYTKILWLNINYWFHVEGLFGANLLVETSCGQTN
jgi:DMSO reductase anchor subunit